MPLISLVMSELSHAPSLRKSVKVEQAIDYEHRVVHVRYWGFLDVAPKEIALPFAWFLSVASVIMKQSAESEYAAADNAARQPVIE
jgi:hypothetical protein